MPHLVFPAKIPLGPMTLSKMCLPTLESTEAKGSSSKQMSASRQTARARAIRCFWPPSWRTIDGFYLASIFIFPCQHFFFCTQLWTSPLTAFLNSFDINTVFKLSSKEKKSLRSWDWNHGLLECFFCATQPPQPRFLAQEAIALWIEVSRRVGWV